MKKILVSAALVVSLASVPAFAKGKPAGRGNDKHEEKSEKWKDKEKDKGEKDRGEKSKDHKEKRWDGKKDSDHGRAASDGRPAGWDKGKKTGWGNCDVPPGQAKKQGCRGTTSKRPVVVARRDPQDRRRTYPQDRTRTYPPRRPTTTATTTTTTTTTTTSKKGTHPFEPVLRQKQEGGKDQRTIKQSVK
jgi:hypothetical protein